ncbi:MAG: DNA-directed RNA polymerase subunit omega [Candidatus Omnitrophota bacterium]
MKEISMDILMTKAGSLYKLCNMAAVRAVELNSGAKKLVDADPKEKFTTTAIREIEADKVSLKKTESAK